jgi:molybdopterin molybdotransferase
MAFVATVEFRRARETIVEKVKACRNPSTERAALEDAAWRVLAEDVTADRDYPSRPRSIRDGYAVRSADLPGDFEVIGEVRAGEDFRQAIGPRQTVEIMTGAPVPEGADQIVMVEYTRRDGARVTTEKGPAPGEFVNPKGSEARRGDVVLPAGRRLDYASIALLATVGRTAVKVFRQPSVAIIPTGDEIVDVSQTPLDYQIRNSNSHSLAVQVRRAGGTPLVLPVAADEYHATRELIERGLQADLLLLSGGVSAGKYDVVETVLAGLGAEFYFDGTLIQPGRPTVFGKVGRTFFFGLPGNPASTMVTFEVFARAALELLAGQSDVALPFFPARLTRDFRHKPGLTRFLPASLSADGAELTPIPWQGSSDIPAVAQANAFLVAAPDRESWQAGEWMPVLPK